MNKLFLPLLVLLVVSCSSDKPDCIQCEEKLRMCQNNQIIPIELPEEKPVSEIPSESYISVSITENNQYLLKENEYDFENLIPELKKAIDASPFKIKGIKIAGHRLAHYESVFNVISFCEANELNPILAYKK